MIPSLVIDSQIRSRFTTEFREFARKRKRMTNRFFDQKMTEPELDRGLCKLVVCLGRSRNHYKTENGVD